MNGRASQRATSQPPCGPSHEYLQTLVLHSQFEVRNVRSISPVILATRSISESRDRITCEAVRRWACSEGKSSYRFETPQISSRSARDCIFVASNVVETESATGRGSYTFGGEGRHHESIYDRTTDISTDIKPWAAKESPAETGQGMGYCLGRHRLVMSAGSAYSFYRRTQPLSGLMGEEPALFFRNLSNLSVNAGLKPN
jgi:hypothetical protein